MADVSVKMGVSGVQQFKQSMTEAQASVKTLDAALKLNEKQLKNAGSAEAYMAAQSSILTEKLNAQKRIVQNAQQALQQMEANGLKRTTKSYQDMQRKLIEAQTAMMDTQEQIDNLGSSSTQAAAETDKLADSLGGLNKKVSLEQVISGIDRITGGMEKAAKSVINFAKTAWNEITELAGYADDIATNATKAGMSPEEYQAWANVLEGWADTSVDVVLKARQRIRNEGRAMMEEGGLLDTMGIFSSGTHLFGFDQHELYNWEDMFWKIGDALLNMSDEYKRAEYAQEIFGAKWEELLPLFTMGREEFENRVAEEKNRVASDEAIENLAVFHDKLGELENKIKSLELTLAGALAPGLTAAAEAIGTFLDKLMEFLQTEEGQALLDRLSESIAGLFEDLGSIDPESVVNNLVTVFEKIIGGLEWLIEHKDEVITALGAIVTGWGLLELTGGALDILRLIDGLKGLGGKGGSPTLPTTGSQPGGGGVGTIGLAATGWASNAAALFTMYDPTGLTALAPAVLGDSTVFGRHIRDGGSVGEAAEASWESIKVSAEAGLNNFGDYFMKDLPNAFWRVMGFKDANDAATTFATNSRIAGEWTFGDEYSAEELMAMVTSGEPVPIPAEVEVPEDAAEQIAQDVGVVQIPAEVYVSFVGGAGGSRYTEYMPHANGLPYVPFDGYPALLHRGEQVLPAREVSSRSYSSNLYVESMYMNNGQDADGLAAAMAAAQRRTSAGYGS